MAIRTTLQRQSVSPYPEGMGRQGSAYLSSGHRPVLRFRWIARQLFKRGRALGPVRCTHEAHCDGHDQCEREAGALPLGNRGARVAAVALVVPYPPYQEDDCRCVGSMKSMLLQ